LGAIIVSGGDLIWFAWIGEDALLINRYWDAAQMGAIAA
jgi:hypothetical protein